MISNTTYEMLALYWDEGYGLRTLQARDFGSWSEICLERR